MVSISIYLKQLLLNLYQIYWILIHFSYYYVKSVSSYIDSQQFTQKISLYFFRQS